MRGGEQRDAARRVSGLAGRQGGVWEWARDQNFGEAASDFFWVSGLASILESIKVITGERLLSWMM